MKKKIIRISLLLCLFAFTSTSILAGTATGSANSGEKGGQNCAKISKKDRQNTGAMKVSEVFVNGSRLNKGTDYTVENDDSTRPVIKFTKVLDKEVKVEVELSTTKPGTFDAVVTLTKCK